MAIDTRRASVATHASSRARLRTTFRSSARTKLPKGATCIGCASTNMSVAEDRPGFPPVPCMHCEHAPCEPVCPVAASVHDSEGLNLQVYNRCVGTRFCQSNCPYKVRRFNFFGYADGQEYGDFGAEIVKAVFNPDVTVRGRGVMEKCTYCVQRISRRAARRRKGGPRDPRRRSGYRLPGRLPDARDQIRQPGDSEVTRHKVRDDPQAYALLGELGTRPRTTYLARLQNPNPDLGRVRDEHGTIAFEHDHRSRAAAMDSAGGPHLRGGQ